MRPDDTAREESWRGLIGRELGGGYNPFHNQDQTF